MRKIKNRAKALLYAQGPGRFYAPAYRNLAESMRGDEGPFLDLGCGTGALVRALADCRPDTSVVGIDRNPSAVQEAADGHRDLQHVLFREMHAESLEFEAGAFGTVSAVQNLMHWKELSTVLGEAHRVLRPGGALIIFQAGGAGPIPEEWLDRPMGWPPDRVLRARWRRYQPPEKVLRGLPESLRDAGFKEVHVGREGFYRYWRAFR